MAARRSPGPHHSVRVGHRLEHLHVNAMRAIAVLEHQLRPAGAKRVGGEARRQRLVHQAARVGWVQPLADEVVGVSYRKSTTASGMTLRNSTKPAAPAVAGLASAAAWAGQPPR